IQRSGTASFQVNSSTEQGPDISALCKSTTYLGLIAYVIQDSPDKMLTFSQLMDKLGAFLSGDRKGIENNIRVCLSSNDCFVKVPVSPYMPHSKKNFWKVDESQITAKMARRHFKGILDLFPDLSTKVRMEAEQISERFAAGFSPKPTLTSPHMQNNNEVKFRGAFSIESILNRDSTSRLCPRPAALAVVSSALHVASCVRTALSRGMYFGHISHILVPYALEASVLRIFWPIFAKPCQYTLQHRLRGHYHFYTTGYQHIQIMIDIFSLKTLF
uniref:Zgc:113424 n=1 Tax=Salmo trutta TaxID=8032 RepID=A0A674EGD5_SALTR